MFIAINDHKTSGAISEGRNDLSLEFVRTFRPSEMALKDHGSPFYKTSHPAGVKSSHWISILQEALQLIGHWRVTTLTSVSGETRQAKAHRTEVRVDSE